MTSLVWDGVTPSDVDVSLSIAGRHVLGDLKLRGAPIKPAQHGHLTRMLEALDRGSLGALGFYAFHDHLDTREAVDAGQAVVGLVWGRDGWRPVPRPVTLFELLDAHVSDWRGEEAMHAFIDSPGWLG